MQAQNSDTLIDRTKLIYFGVRDWFIGVIEQEKKEFEAAQQVVVTRDYLPNEGDDCPSCHAKESMRECAAGIVRCMQCAWQPRIVNAPGISRSQLESFRYPDAEHKRKFQQGFGHAIARITGRK